MTDLQLILEAAQEAGRLAPRHPPQGPGGRVQGRRPQPVTNADLAADRLLTERLRQARPEYGWLSEETADASDGLDCRRIFVVDPIDGTRAFLKGRPWWSVAIAVVEDGRPIAGAVFAPEVGELYGAALGAGRHAQRRADRPQRHRQPDDCRMAGDPVVFQHWSWPRPWPAMRIEHRNSTAYRMCLVAAGDFDAAVAPGAQERLGRGRRRPHRPRGRLLRGRSQRSGVPLQSGPAVTGQPDLRDTGARPLDPGARLAYRRGLLISSETILRCPTNNCSTW
jgi:myo-inositol-1(or 4)-monophosphatase